jgi:hypothetical protein
VTKLCKWMLPATVNDTPVTGWTFIPPTRKLHSGPPRFTPHPHLETSAVLRRVLVEDSTDIAIDW